MSLPAGKQQRLPEDTALVQEIVWHITPMKQQLVISTLQFMCRLSKHDMFISDFQRCCQGVFVSFRLSQASSFPITSRYANLSYMAAGCRIIFTMQT